MSKTPTREQIADLLDKDFTVLEIAYHLRISPAAIYKHIEKYELPLPSEKKREAAS